MKNNENKIEARRSFLKKAAYAVPTVIAISQITNPVIAGASTTIQQGTTPSVTINNLNTGTGSTSTGGTDVSQFNALKSFSSSINN